MSDRARRSVPRLCRSGWLAALLTQVAFAGTSVTPVVTYQAQSLPLDGQGAPTERIVRVATLHISSDSPLGFTLTVTSGNLAKADGNTPIPFQVVTVAEDAPTPTAASFTSGPGEAHIYTSNAAGQSTRVLYLRYVPAALQDPGTYARSVSVSVVDN